MKKLIALLLAIGMVVSLGACKAPGQTPEGTGETENIPASDTSTTPSTEATGTTGVFFPDNSDLIDPEKFGGKTLQIYGYSADSFNDISNMDGVTDAKLLYIWMVRAAIDEWATLNNVEIEFVGGYDHMMITNDIYKGGKPDLLLYCNKFPMPMLDGITRAFTQEEYNTLAGTCGTYYLDMLKYKGQSYGVAAPWAGGEMLYYNKTLFEKHGIKTPGAYFMEGNWNWDTYEKCITEITKDADGDGTYEVYGTAYDATTLIPGFYIRGWDEDGHLVSLVRNSDACQRFLDIYNHIYGDKLNGKGALFYSNTEPRSATSFAEGFWYDFADVHRVLENGDIIEAIPEPKHTNTAESYYEHNTVYSAILSSCDEPEATLSLLHYILRVGMRYMSDYSMGFYHNNYEGIRGASEYAAGWKQQFANIINQRWEALNKLTNLDAELIFNTNNYILDADKPFITLHFPRLDSGTMAYYYISLDYLADREEAWIQQFNELYVK